MKIDDGSFYRKTEIKPTNRIAIIEKPWIPLPAPSAVVIVNCGL